MPPTAKPMSVPATTPRQSIFCSPFVISHLQRPPRRYHNPRSSLWCRFQPFGVELGRRARAKSPGVVRGAVVAPSHYSRRTSLGLLSERRPRIAACRSLPSAVHSTNRICATRFGFTHCISRISSAVTPPRQRSDFEFGRSTKGHSSMCRVLSALATSRRRCGTKPARTLPANRKPASS